MATVGGAVLMVGGTFAPWLRSGQSRRNVYQAAGVLRRLTGLDGPAGVLLSALPWLGLYCAACAVLLIAGRGRLAAGALLTVSVPVAAVCLAALLAPSTAGVRSEPAGPTISGIGAVTATLSIILLARSRTD